LRDEILFQSAPATSLAPETIFFLSVCGMVHRKLTWVDGPQRGVVKSRIHAGIGPLLFGVQDSAFQAQRASSFLGFDGALVKSRSWAEIRRNFSGIIDFHDARVVSGLGFVRRISGFLARFKNG
jgi:hypothetical protein